MKYIKVTPKLDLCAELEGDLFEESHVSCPLEAGNVTLIARKYIPEEVPKVSVQGNVTLTNQDGDVLICTSLVGGGVMLGVHLDLVLRSRDGSNRYWFF
jgi:ML domain